MTELENKIEQLPDGVDMVLYQRSLHPYCEPITTDEIKALLSELRRKTEALERALTAATTGGMTPQGWKVAEIIQSALKPVD